jgi:hypothetical protein
MGNDSLGYRYGAEVRADTLTPETMIQYLNGYVWKIGVVRRVVANINNFETRVFLTNGFMISTRDTVKFQTIERNTQ